MKNILNVIVLICLFSCSRDEEKIIPELTDPDPLPVKISSFNGGNPLRIHYDSDNNIVSISQSDYYNKFDVDSTRFFYKNELLDSVIKYKSWVTTLDTSIFTFLRDQNGRIIKIKQKSTVADYNRDYYIAWEGNKVVRFYCQAFMDTVIYDSSGNLAAVKNRRNHPYSGSKLSNLNKLQPYYTDKFKVIGIVNRPDPYSLIEQKLGYPFFRTDYYPGRVSYYTSWSVNHYIVGGEESSDPGEVYLWDYEYDDKGRISVKFLVKQPEYRYFFEYK